MPTDERFLGDTGPQAADAITERLRWLHQETAQLRHDIAEMTARADLLAAWTASLGAELWAGSDDRPAVPRPRTRPTG